MKKFILATLIVSVIGFPFVVHAQAGGTGDKYGLRTTAREAELNTSQGSVADVAGNVIGAGLTLIGVLFFLLMIYAGILWMLARGNEEQSKKALNTVTAAIIGLVLVIASYAITRFVFQSVSGQTPRSSGGPAAGGSAGCCVACVGTACTRTPIPNNVETLCPVGTANGVTTRIEARC